MTAADSPSTRTTTTIPSRPVRRARPIRRVAVTKRTTTGPTTTRVAPTTKAGPPTGTTLPPPIATPSGRGSAGAGFVGIDVEGAHAFAGLLRAKAGEAGELAVLIHAAMAESGLSSSAAAECLRIDASLLGIARVIDVRADLAHAHRLGVAPPPELLAADRDAVGALRAFLEDEVYGLMDSLAPDDAAGLVLKHFDEIDAAGKRDGRVNADDLVAYAKNARSNGITDPSLLAAVARFAVDATLFSVIDTGGRDEKPDGEISKRDLDEVLRNGIDGESLNKVLAALDVAVTHLDEIDTAGEGGDADGRFSLKDLRAVVKNPSGFDPALVEVSQFLIDHDGLLRHVAEFKARQRHLAVRVVTGLAGAADEAMGFSYALDRDPVGYLRSRWEMAKGVGAGSKDLVVGLMELQGLDPMNPRNMVDPVGYAKRMREFAEGLNEIRKHPSVAFEAMIDLKTLESNPARWVGKQTPELILAILTGGAGKAAGAGTKGATLTRAATITANALDNAATKIDELAQAARLLKARAKAAWTFESSPQGPRPDPVWMGSDTLDDTLRMTEQPLAPGKKGLSLSEVSPGVYESPAGLTYGPGSAEGHRLTHVLEHARPNPNKPVHTVFSTNANSMTELVNQVTGVIDDAWRLRAAPVPGDPGKFVVPMGRVVGTAGERSITIVVRPGTSSIITAFPS